MKHTVTELLGDGVGPELSECIHLVADTLPAEVEFRQVDLSLENRRERGRAIYDEAYAAISADGLAIKYPTVTETESPNAVLRKMCDFTVIHRPVVSMPGVESNFKRELNLDVVRLATGGTYSDPGQPIGGDVAVALRVVERGTARSAAHFAFRLAERLGVGVTSSSKWTIQRAADGLFEDIVAEVAAKHPNVPHRRELFDALLAKVVMRPEDYRIVITPNEYGDFLSDMACGLVGSLGIGPSGSFSFDAEGNVRLAMFDAAHGTAPDIAGKGLVNPTAILLAFAGLLEHVGEDRNGASLRSAVVTTIGEGNKTRDLGGSLGTMEFARLVAERAHAGAA